MNDWKYYQWLYLAPNSSNRNHITNEADLSPKSPIILETVGTSSQQYPINLA